MLNVSSHYLHEREQEPAMFTSNNSGLVQWCWVKLPVPGRPTYLDDSRAWASCACCGCGGGCLDSFLSSIISLFFLPLSG